MSNKVNVIDHNQIDKNYYKNQFTSCIILSYDNKIILQKRGNDFYTYPGYLCTFGGKIETAESPLETIIRELKEELDIEVSSSELVFISAYTEEISQHEDLVYGYFWHDKDNKIKTCHEGEIAYFDSISDILKNKKLLDDVPFLLTSCENKKLINNTCE